LRPIKISPTPRAKYEPISSRVDSATIQRLPMRKMNVPQAKLVNVLSFNKLPPWIGEMQYSGD